jgi:hypothetical protein
MYASGSQVARRVAKVFGAALRFDRAEALDWKGAIEGLMVIPCLLSSMPQAGAGEGRNAMLVLMHAGARVTEEPSPSARGPNSLDADRDPVIIRSSYLFASAVEKSS